MTTTEVVPAPTNDHGETRHSDEDSYSTAEEEELMIGSSGESDEEGGSIGEREEGDGQESIPNKALDDDEDKKNPQYIPKRGGFYEHDDRMEPGEESPVQKPKEAAPQRKPSRVAADRWLHDRYDERQQAPKSEEELIATYGYDIRKGDGAPRARRRRRYGGGPKQYTRSWEDEEAYRRNSTVQRGSRKNSRVGKHPVSERENGPPQPEDNEEFPSLGGQEERPRRQEKKEELEDRSPVNHQEKKDMRKQSEEKNHVRRKSSDKTDTHRYDNGPQRGGRPLRGRSSKVDIDIPPGAEEEALQKGIEGLHVTEQGNTYQKAELPPRLQEAANRPKRYSTQRLQTGSPAPSLVAVIPQHSPPLVLAAAMGSAFGSAAGVRVPAPAFYDQAAFQQPPQASTLPNFASPFSSAPFHVPFASAPPPVPYADFVAPAATAAAFAGVPQDQLAYQPGLFSSQQALSPAQEVYQGGVTYYAPQGHIPVTQIIQKRPNAAIPIIAPPELEERSEAQEIQTEEHVVSEEKEPEVKTEEKVEEQN